jgi:hypothetical protein
MANGRFQHVLTWLLCGGLALSACREDKTPELHPALEKLESKPKLPTAPGVDPIDPVLANALVSRTRAPLHVDVVTCFQHPAYSYLEVRDKSGSGWVVVPSLHADRGARVSLLEYVRMRNFKAADLDVDVGNVLFVAKVAGPSVVYGDTGQEAAVDPALPAMMVTRTEALIELPELVQADLRIGQLYAARDEMAGKQVKIRGQVLQIAPQIGNRNWVFLRDGSGSKRTRWLVALIEETADLGEVLVVEGRVEVERSFRIGDRHLLLLGDATVVSRDLDESGADSSAAPARAAAKPNR